MFNYDVSQTEVQSLCVLGHHQGKKGNKNIQQGSVSCSVQSAFLLYFNAKNKCQGFKFHATSLASNQSPTPNNAIKCTSNRRSHLSAQIIPVFFVLCSLGKFRLSISCKMPIIGQSTTCKIFNMGDVISHLR